MGWCSGGDFVYPIIDIFKKEEYEDIPMNFKREVIKRLIDEALSKDWDCVEPSGIPWIDELLGYYPCSEDGCEKPVYRYHKDDEEYCWDHDEH